ncbi:hypothetical protein TSAR_009648 [Trichomalopsis sarcophagae]|uniref:Uncharacterized protein n=1 Tax=Trichomalopsis sarcophagae TaxID=543379 RepID=A0A232FD10_9HYME|nr:hypothetical protein TSAR_009648 [Trichomalopsis sarcophagae]
MSPSDGLAKKAALNSQYFYTHSSASPLLETWRIKTPNTLALCVRVLDDTEVELYNHLASVNHNIH